jgi:2,4-dienoyl-CoA reductase-like NADH-dependent reductase (Old Yellow Enzyme family)
VHGESDARIAPQIVHFMKISRSGYRQKVEDLSVREIKEIPALFAWAAERARTGNPAVRLQQQVQRG